MKVTISLHQGTVEAIVHWALANGCPVPINLQWETETPMSANADEMTISPDPPTKRESLLSALKLIAGNRNGSVRTMSIGESLIRVNRQLDILGTPWRYKEARGLTRALQSLEAEMPDFIQVSEAERGEERTVTLSVHASQEAAPHYVTSDD